MSHDLFADHGLVQDPEQVAPDQVFEVFEHLEAAGFGHRKAIAIARVGWIEIESGQNATDALEAVVEIEHHIIEQKPASELDGECRPSSSDLFPAANGWSLRSLVSYPTRI